MVRYSEGDNVEYSCNYYSAFLYYFFQILRRNISTELEISDRRETRETDVLRVIVQFWKENGRKILGNKISMCM